MPFTAVTAVIASIQTPPPGRRGPATVRYAPRNLGLVDGAPHFILDDPPANLEAAVGTTIELREFDITVRGQVWAVRTGHRRYRLAPRPLPPPPPPPPPPEPEPEPKPKPRGKRRG